MITPEQKTFILSNAYVPEHIPGLMTLISRGEPELFDDYIAFRGENWCILVGYPLKNEHSEQRLQYAIETINRNYSPESILLIAPSIPEACRKSGVTIEKDRYYSLPLEGYTPPGRLLREVRKASEQLRFSTSDKMTDDHRLLTNEFLERVELSNIIQELYRSMPRYIKGSETAMVLEARTLEGGLSAFFVVDTAATKFLTYLVGCHSRTHYVPHASDFIFHEMIALARGYGKREINLGLGVNEGIARFKIKWGGLPGLEYQSCEYRPASDIRTAGVPRPLPGEESRNPRLDGNNRRDGNRVSLIRWLKGERKLRMTWRLNYRGRESVLVASAHFSPHSFQSSLNHFISCARTVIFEGPLDPPDMEKVRTRGSGSREHLSLCEALRPETIQKINQYLGGPEGMRNPAFAAKARALKLIDENFLQDETRGLRPWMALFGIWTRFLSFHGWNGSVDLEAYDIARRLNRKVVFLETIEAQVEAMEGIPFEKIVQFFESFDRWERFAHRYKSYYLRGNIDAIMGSTVVFPTRCESIVDKRDPVFFNGMKPFVEEGGALAFFGVIHMRGVIKLLREWGCEVTKL